MTDQQRLPHDLSGHTFGRLTVVDRSPVNKQGRPAKKVSWRCRCECGGETITPRSNLISGKARSCGCLNKEAAAERARGRTGMQYEWASCRQPEYHVWRAMVNRCHLETSAGYSKYGAKGVSVCDRWRGSYQAFIEDMGRRPGDRFTIERLDVFGNYEPDNCIWLEGWKQGWNKRDNKLDHEKAAEIRSRRAAGESLKSLAADFGIHVSMVSLVALGKCWSKAGDVARKDRER